METMEPSRSADQCIGAQYDRALARRTAHGILLLLLLIALAVISLCVGTLPLSPGDMTAALFGGGVTESRFHHVIWDIRMPRSAGAIVAGAGLGLSGAVMQNILKNPLASPFTIGVSQGAAFGAAIAIIVFGAGQTYRAGEGVTLAAPHLVVLSAFAGSLITVTLILLLSLLRSVSSEALILAGVALSAFFGAGTMLLQYFASDMQVAATVFWTFGDLAKAGWVENAVMSAAVLIPLAYFMSASWSYNALLWGDEVATSLGVRVRMHRCLGMVLSAFTVSAITSFLGIIGFIGLIAPHLVRFISGNDHRFLIPFSAILGSLLLLASDIIARSVMPPIVLPVGIITSFTGAPLFLYLLIKGGRR